MKNFKSHFKFNKQERSGIFFLLLIIILLQSGYFLLRSFPVNKSKEYITVNDEVQSQIDILKENLLKRDTIKIYPFNPNFISDYKGYSLGMSVHEIDRLHSFRSKNKYVNSPEEFQKITQISDSLLSVISPYFKFPEWINKNNQHRANDGRVKQVLGKQNRSIVKVKDLNKITAEDLKLISGIGDKLSRRIIKFRDRLGGFLIDEQLYDVYGLEPDVVLRTLKQFKVITKPKIVKININTASVDEIAKLVYIQKHVANRIVDYRNINETIDSFDELIKIQDFPSNKIDRIKLYLTL